MRPSALFFIMLAMLLISDCIFLGMTLSRQRYAMFELPALQQLTARLGLSDLVISTEARYTRNPAVTDQAAPFMDHPGSIEHFPSGSFILPSGQKK